MSKDEDILNSAIDAVENEENVSQNEEDVQNDENQVQKQDDVLENQESSTETDDQKATIEKLAKEVEYLKKDLSKKSAKIKSYRQNNNQTQNTFDRETVDRIRNAQSDEEIQQAAIDYQNKVESEQRVLQLKNEIMSVEEQIADEIGYAAGQDVGRFGQLITANGGAEALQYYCTQFVTDPRFRNQDGSYNVEKIHKVMKGISSKLDPFREFLEESPKQQVSKPKVVKVAGAPQKEYKSSSNSAKTSEDYYTEYCKRNNL